MRQLLHISFPVHHTASRPHSLAYLSNPGLSFPMKCSLLETENLTSTNGCIFSRALCHKITLLFRFSETGNGIAEIERSTLLKASANLRKQKAWFFRVLISIALYLVTVRVPFDCICNDESFTLVSDRSGLQAGDRSDRQHVISAHLWGVWPDQRHTAKFPSEAGWAGKALKKSKCWVFWWKILHLAISCGLTVFNLWPVCLWIQAYWEGAYIAVKAFMPPPEKLECENQSCEKHQILHRCHDNHN